MTHLSNNSAFSFVPPGFVPSLPGCHGLPSTHPHNPALFSPALLASLQHPPPPPLPPSLPGGQQTLDFLTLDLLQRFTQYSLYRSTLPFTPPNPFLAAAAGLQFLHSPPPTTSKPLLLPPSPLKTPAIMSSSTSQQQISPISLKLSPTSPAVSSGCCSSSQNTSCNSSLGGVAASPPKHQCEACGRQYTTQAGLGKHRCQSARPGSTKAYACQHCEKAYFSLSALKMHIRTHTLPCRCHLCGKAFSRMWLLQGHLRTHTGERPFRCEQCGRAFADRSNLRAHMQTHSAEKKYKCLTCPKSFSRMGLLVKHRSTGCQGNAVQQLQTKRSSQPLQTV